MPDVAIRGNYTDELAAIPTYIGRCLRYIVSKASLKSNGERGDAPGARGGVALAPSEIASIPLRPRQCFGLLPRLMLREHVRPQPSARHIVAWETH